VTGWPLTSCSSRDPGDTVGGPVEEIVRRSGLAETFKRRFAEAIGFAPIEYVQRPRSKNAKRRLERMDASADEVSWQVGYEDAAFFPRLFKRFTGMTPGAYRKRFRCPPSLDRAQSRRGANYRRFI
jgi:transcriptional regulator GlxA family with amidase domain